MLHLQKVKNLVCLPNNGFEFIDDFKVLCFGCKIYNYIFLKSCKQFIEVYPHSINIMVVYLILEFFLTLRAKATLIEIL